MTLRFLDRLFGRSLKDPFKYEFAVPSAVRVCFVGIEGAGSFEMRGRQMAATRLNWQTRSTVSRADEKQFDVFCFVKVPQPREMKRLTGIGKKVVFDIVDSWKQPQDDLDCHNRDQARRLFLSSWAEFPSDALLFPNAQMRNDFSDVPQKSCVLYHHYRPEAEFVPVRSQARILAYEGEQRFLGEWELLIERACGETGWEFQINPSSLREADVGISVRGAPYSGFLGPNYKSNVKLANFYGWGLPCLIHDSERACRETAVDGVRFFNGYDDLVDGLKILKSSEKRLQIQRSFSKVREHFSLKHLAGELERFLSSI
jgi:hypothetical protein